MVASKKEIRTNSNAFTTSQLRFGRALARLRTRHQAEVQQKAAEFLQAAGHQRKPRKMSSDFSSWVKKANLNPVIEYLT